MGVNTSKDTNESSGLTNRQKEAIRASWQVMEKNQKAIGIDFFVRLLTDNPRYLKTFARFRNLDVEDLENCKALHVHAVTFMKGMGTLVENVDDLDCLDELLYKIAARHQPFGLKGTDLKKGTDMFAGSLNPNPAFDGLDYPTEFIAQSWQRAFDMIIPIIGEYIDDLQRAEDDS